MAIIFGIATVICAVMWFCTLLALEAVIYYLADHGYAAPTQEEIRACIKKVSKRKFPWYSKYT